MNDQNPNYSFDVLVDKHELRRWRTEPNEGVDFLFTVGTLSWLTPIYIILLRLSTEYVNEASEYFDS